MTGTPNARDTAARPAFSHASEAELARIFDFYDVRWEYEPDTFPIGWTLDGDVVESFAPDFYLPELELYVELTTLKQSLVRRKNRKLRRLRELYPDVRIKLFYARDFRQLLLKFGRFALAEELSGTVGQATPPRAQILQVERTPTDETPAPAEVTGPEGRDGSGSSATASPAARPSRGRRRGRRRRAAARAAASANEPITPVTALAARSSNPVAPTESGRA